MSDEADFHRAIMSDGKTANDFECVPAGTLAKLERMREALNDSRDAITWLLGAQKNKLVEKAANTKAMAAVESIRAALEADHG